MDLRSAWSEGTLLALVFIVVIADMFVSGVSASESFWIWAPGLVIWLPSLLIQAVSTAFPILGPLGALLILLYLVKLKEIFGDAIYLMMFAGALVISFGV